MRNTCLSKMWSWTVLFLMLIVTIPAAAADVPFEAYGRLPAIEDVAISPDGTSLALVKSVNGERILYILSLTGEDIKGACKIGDTKLRGIGWADDNHVLMVVSTTSAPPRGFSGPKSEFAMLLAYDISAEKIYNPLNVNISSKDITWNTIIGNVSVRQINGETIVFVMGIYVQGNRTQPALYKLNLTTDDADFARHGNDKSRGWLVDENGEIVASQTYDTRIKRWAISVRKDGDMVEVANMKMRVKSLTVLP